MLTSYKITVSASDGTKYIAQRKDKPKYWIKNDYQIFDDNNQDTKYWIESDGSIKDGQGNDTGFYLQDEALYGPEDSLPWEA